MAPPKASGWPAYIFNDPAVQTLDERGRFIVCGVCAEYYATCGGKRPKPIVLNGCYRTRAWEVHKQRTRAHNPYEDDPPPIMTLPAPTANSRTPARLLDEPFRWRPYEPRPIDRRYGQENAAAGFNHPPLRDRRRSFSPPRSPSTPTPTWRRHHSVAPQSFARASQQQYSHQPRPRTRRMTPGPVMPTTIVFPLVRTPAELRRRRSDSDPDWTDNRAPSYDWRRLLSSSSPSTFNYELRAVNTAAPVRFTGSSCNEPLKAPAYAVPEVLQ